MTIALLCVAVALLCVTAVLPCVTVVLLCVTVALLCVAVVLLRVTAVLLCATVALQFFTVLMYSAKIMLHITFHFKSYNAIALSGYLSGIQVTKYERLPWELGAFQITKIGNYRGRKGVTELSSIFMIDKIMSSIMNFEVFCVSLKR